MIDLATSRTLSLHLASTQGARLLEPGDPRVAFGVSVVEGLAHVVPGAGPIVADIRALVSRANENVSVTVPAPGGTLVILSKSAIQSGRSFFRTSMHEFVHVSQVARVGGGQAGVDWLGSGELRGGREAEASALGMWADFLVSGEKPNVDDASVLTSALYHLDPPDKEFARNVVRSVLGVIATGAVPPFAVAQAALVWLRANSPESILVSDYR